MGFWDSISDSFSTDGSATRFLEKIPIVGYGVAGVQAMTGNTEHAKRALGTSTNNLIVTAGVAGAAGTAALVGPIVTGAALAGAAASVDLFSEHGIDEAMKGRIGGVSLEGLLDPLHLNS